VLSAPLPTIAGDAAVVAVDVVVITWAVEAVAMGAMGCAAADVPLPRFCCSMPSYGCNNGGGGVAVDVVNRTLVGVATVVITGDDGVVGRRVAAAVDFGRGETKTSVVDDRIAFAGGRSNKLLFGRCIHCMYRVYLSSIASRIFRISSTIF